MLPVQRIILGYIRPVQPIGLLFYNSKTGSAGILLVEEPLLLLLLLLLAFDMHKIDQLTWMHFLISLVQQTERQGRCAMPMLVSLMLP